MQLILIVSPQYTTNLAIRRVTNVSSATGTIALAPLHPSSEHDSQKSIFVYDDGNMLLKQLLDVLLSSKAHDRKMIV